MKPGWGAGTAVAILLPIALYFFGLFGPQYTLSAVELLFSFILLLTGLWTLLAGFTIAEAKDRTYYSVWGVVLACVSLFAYLPATYAVGILLIAVIILILLIIYSGKNQEIFTAATNPPPPAGGTPAAEP